MCVIIVKPEGILIREKDLNLAWQSNHDGAGIIIPQKNPKVIKGIMTLGHLKEILKSVDTQFCIVHLRFATHGSKTSENTHPFKAGDRRWLMHNGVLGHYGESGEKGFSDSAHLASDISPLPNPAIRRILNSISGKFVFVDRNTVSIHGAFQEKNNCQWSNLNWDREKIPVSRYYGSEFKGKFKSLSLPHKRNTETPRQENWEFSKNQNERVNDLIQDVIGETDPSFLLRSKYEHLTEE